MKSETINFHKGNGWNFQVTYNQNAQLTYLNRYHTNGHLNSPDATKVFLHIEEIKSYEEAEYKFQQDRYAFITKEEAEIKPLNKIGAKARIKAIKELQDFDDKYQSNAYAAGFTKAIENCKINE